MCELLAHGRTEPATCIRADIGTRHGTQRNAQIHVYANESHLRGMIGRGCGLRDMLLHFAAIPDDEIAHACERFGVSLDTWRRQERAFGLLRKVYAKRAAIRRGGYVYRVPDGSTVYVPRDIGWCADCQTITDIQLGFSAAELEPQCRSLAAALPAKPPSFLSRLFTRPESHETEHTRSELR